MYRFFPLAFFALCLASVFPAHGLPRDRSSEQFYPFVPSPSPPQEIILSEIRELQTKLRANSDNPELHVELGFLYETNRKYQEALKEYSVAHDLQPQNERYQLALAGAYCKTGEFEVAEALLSALLKKGRAGTEALILFAYILQQQGQVARSDSILERVLRTEPNNTYALYLSGINRFQSNKWEEARVQLERAAELHIELGQTFHYLGLIFSRDSSTYPLALKSFQRARKLNWSPPELCKELGAIYFRTGQYGEAVKELEGALQLRPTFAEAYYTLASVYRRLGEKAKQEQAFAKYQELHAADLAKEQALLRGETYYQQGLKQLSDKRLDDAYQSLQKALGMYARSDAVYYSLAQIHFSKKEFPQAIELSEKAIKENPEVAEYHALLAECLTNVKDHARAIERMRTAILLNPVNPEYYNYLGYLHFTVREFSRAIEAYRKASQLEPQSPVYHFNLSVALEMAGAKEESKKEYEQYLRLR